MRITYHYTAMCKSNYILADNLRRIRKKLDLSQEKFAEAVDLSMRTIVNIETGKHFPKAKNIDKICEKLNMECFELFIDRQKELSANCKITEIVSMLNGFDENKLDRIYKITETFLDDKV